jgi:Na+-transporting NADH:ubiquinone oxidoreductase subunit NqrB
MTLTRTLRYLATFSLPKTDPRHYQIAFLGTFLSTGILLLGWHIQIWNYLTLATACIGTQLLLAHFTNKDYASWRSALITTLGLSLLLKANHLPTFALAGAVAIASKYAFQFRKKHFFNPANIGIVVAILLTGDAWVSPGQWGHNAVLCFGFVALGAMVTHKVGRWDTSAVFLGLFGALTFCYDVLYKGWTPDVWAHKMCSGSLLLFAFFMITDPRAIPDRRLARVIWASIVAVAVFIVSTQFYVHTAVIWVLFVASPLTPLFDYLLPAPRFQWKAA